MRMEQGVRTDLGHGGITCVLQTQFSSLVVSKQSRKPVSHSFIQIAKTPQQNPTGKRPRAFLGAGFITLYAPK